MHLPPQSIFSSARGISHGQDVREHASCDFDFANQAITKLEFIKMRM
jgi:hypothetical protein